jgi:pantoate--beta-alanine ligase
MSSRNARLSPEARVQAKILPDLLDSAQEMLDSATFASQTDRGPVLAQWLGTLLESNMPSAQVDYIAVVDPETLEGVDEIQDRALVALAIRIGGVRLIDNRLITRHR